MHYHIINGGYTWDFTAQNSWNVKYDKYFGTIQKGKYDTLNGTEGVVFILLEEKGRKNWMRKGRKRLKLSDQIEKVNKKKKK